MEDLDECPAYDFEALTVCQELFRSRDTPFGKIYERLDRAPTGFADLALRSSLR